MYRFLFIVSSLLLVACVSFNQKAPVRDHGACNVATLFLDNSLNDTTRVRLIRTVVFDTTSQLVHGYIIDDAYRPIQNSSVVLFNGLNTYVLQTNTNGEFEIFRELFGGRWNLLIKHPGYICLYVVNVVQTGGQWLAFKLQRE